MLNGYMDKDFVCICQNTTQPPAVSTSHVTAKYRPETNMSSNWSTYVMCAKYLTVLYEWCIHIYMPHMKWLTSTMEQENHMWHILLKQYGYHIANMAYTGNMLDPCIDHTFFVYIYQATTNWNRCFTCYCHICVRNEYVHKI